MQHAPESFVPLLDAQERAEVTMVPARAPCLLMVHPRRWEVSGGKVRPMLARLWLIPGVSNVQVGAGGSLRVGMARAHYEERGYKVLDASTLPPSQRWRKSYLTRPAGRPDVTLLYWEQCFPGASSLRCDEAAKEEFLDWLVDSGLLPAPAPYVLERLRDEAMQEASRLADRAQSFPSYRPLAEAAIERVKIIEAALDGASAVRPAAESEPVGLDLD